MWIDPGPAIAPLPFCLSCQADLARARSSADAAAADAATLGVEAEGLRKALRAMESRLAEYQAKDTEVHTHAAWLYLDSNCLRTCLATMLVAGYIIYGHGHDLFGASSRQHVTQGLEPQHGLLLCAMT